MMRRFAPVLLAAMLAACSAGGGADEVAPPAAERLPQHLEDLPARLLAMHNRERAAVGAPPLLWDDGLAAAAAAYAPALVRLGRLEHSPPASRTGQGENLWMGTAEAYRLEEMFGAWADEKRLLRAGTFPNVSTSGRWQDVAHYTQIVWRSTQRVGCAVHGNRQWDYLICRYAPAGNVVGQPVP
jgi:hypothetical protein